MSVNPLVASIFNLAELSYQNNGFIFDEIKVALCRLVFVYFYFPNSTHCFRKAIKTVKTLNFDYFEGNVSNILYKSNI